MNKNALLILAFSLLLIILPFFWRHPFPYAFESALHIRTSIGFSQAFADDPGYPDWFAVPYNGRGTPLFRFLGPFPLFVAMLFQFIGIPGYLAAKLTFLCFFLLGSLAAYHLTDTECKKFKPAFFLILTNPYIVLFLHFAFQFQNVCAYFLFPLIILGWQKLANDEKGGWHILSLTLGIMACTHLQTTLLTFYASILFGLFLCVQRQQKRFLPLTLILAAAAFSFFFAAPYILPAMSTMHETFFSDAGMRNLAPGGQTTPFLNNHLVIENSVTIPVYKGFSLIFAYLGISPASNHDIYLLSSASRFEHFRPWIMAMCLLVFAIGLFALLKSENSSYEKTLLVSGLSILLMSFSLTKPLWDILPGLHFVQFPWRVVFPASTMILVGANRYLINMFEKNTGKAIIMLILPWLLLITIFTLPGKAWPEKFLDESLQKGSYPPFLPKSIPRDAKLSELSGQPHRFRVLPHEQVFDAAETGLSWANYSFENIAETRQLNILTHFDPYWRARMLSKGAIDQTDYQELPIAADRDGTIQVAIPAGSYSLSLYRLRPHGRAIGYLLFFLASGFWLISLRKIRQK